jgi:hypothetical protein
MVDIWEADNGRIKFQACLGRKDPKTTSQPIKAEHDEFLVNLLNISHWNCLQQNHGKTSSCKTYLGTLE